LTEAASQVATRPPSAIVASDSDLSGGLEALPGVEIRIVDEQQNRVGRGVEGEIQVRGPIVMQTYLDDPVSTSQAIREGWLATGDIGRLDPNGRLRVIDRRSDLIVSGGENVYPAEIESVLVSHPEIEDGGVVGIPDPEFGARPVAFVVLREGASLDRSRLESFCRERLASFKIPVDFIAISELPRTASGKLLRRLLPTRN
jgi:O-succinylbenzoic acid--CoA ligase